MARNLIEIINDSNIIISGYAFRMMRNVIKHFFIHLLVPYNVSIVIIDDKGIKDLNCRHLMKNEFTDVISFSFLNNYENCAFFIQKDKSSELYSLNDSFDFSKCVPWLNIGEAYISIDQVLAYMEINKTSMSRELNWLLTHALLHMIGYTDYTEQDKNIMFQKARCFLQCFYSQKNKKKRG